MSGQEADICPPEIEVEEDIDAEIEQEIEIEAEEESKQENSDPNNSAKQDELNLENNTAATATEKINNIYDIYEYFEKNITHLSSEQKSELNKYSKDMEIELLKLAIKEAVDCNAKSYKYVNAILKDCSNKKIFTVGQFLERQKQHEKDKQKLNINKQDHRNSYQRYEQRDYKTEELNSIYANKK